MPVEELMQYMLNLFNNTSDNLHKEYEKLDKASDEFLSNEKKTVEDYILEKERLATMQTLAYCRDNLEELLEEK